MAKKQEVNKLLTNMKSAGRANAPEKTSGKGLRLDALKRRIDLSHYKEHQAWPGRSFLLVGNSFNAEKKVKSSRKDSKRAGSIAMLLERGKSNRHCITVEEAMADAAFVENLSRFEFDWLRREGGDSLIGPAYDERGHLVPESFAVWRKQPHHSRVDSGSEAEERSMALSRQ